MSTLYSRNPDVLSRRLGDSMVLVHLGSNEIYELNETGARLWEELEEGADVEQLVRALVEEFEVEEGRLRADVRTLLGELEAKKLVTSGPRRP